MPTNSYTGPIQLVTRRGSKMSTVSDNAKAECILTY